MTHPEPLGVNALATGRIADEVDRAIAALRPAGHLVEATAIDLGGTTARVTTRDRDTPTTTRLW